MLKMRKWVRSSERSRRPPCLRNISCNPPVLFHPQEPKEEEEEAVEITWYRRSGKKKEQSKEDGGVTEEMTELMEEVVSEGTTEKGKYYDIEVVVPGFDSDTDSIWHRQWPHIKPDRWCHSVWPYLHTPRLDFIGQCSFNRTQEVTLYNSCFSALFLCFQTSESFSLLGGVVSGRGRKREGKWRKWDIITKTDLKNLDLKHLVQFSNYRNIFMLIGNCLFHHWELEEGQTSQTYLQL